VIGNFGDKAAKGMISSAKRLLEQKAAELRKEAEEMIKEENAEQEEKEKERMS
jgi:hypothetical protein